MRYWICEADTVQKLQARVDELLREGWRTAGGLCVVNSHQTGNWWFYQAVVFDGDLHEPPEASEDPEFKP